MRKLLAFLLPLLVPLSIAKAQVPLTHGGLGAPAVAAGCSQATTYLSGKTYTGGQNTAITTFICNEVSNGNWAHFQMVAFAFGGSSNDVFNWVTNTAMTFHGSITRNSPGWTGDGSTGYIDVGVGAGHAPASQNSASIGACVVNSRTTGINSEIIGMQDSGAAPQSLITPYSASVNTGYGLTGGFVTFASSNAQGFWAVERVASTGVTLYLNGSSVATPSDTSAAPNTLTMYLLAKNGIGTATAFSSDTGAYFFMGDGSVNVANFYTDAHALWTAAAVGGAGGC